MTTDAPVEPPSYNETESKEKADEQHSKASSEKKLDPRIERTFITFSDESSFRRAYRLRKRKPAQRSYCLITRLVIA